ncbi:hypothetical protein Hdeb2414_s0005g00171441 [Helianthus debilis subsp. tardiflorus]
MTQEIVHITKPFKLPLLLPSFSAEHPSPPLIHFRFCSSHSNHLQASKITHKESWSKRKAKDLSTLLLSTHFSHP